MCGELFHLYFLTYSLNGDRNIMIFWSVFMFYNGTNDDNCCGLVSFEAKGYAKLGTGMRTSTRRRNWNNP